MRYSRYGTSTTYFRLFVYIILLNTTIMSAGIIFHEFGHYFVGTELLQCEGSITLYDAQYNGPYTKFNCPIGPYGTIIHASSFLLIIPFAAAFLLLKEFPERYFFIVIVGFAIFSAALDIESISGMQIFRDIFLFSGMLIHVGGLYFLTDSTFKRFRKKV